jgi:hypothetical protein
MVVCLFEGFRRLKAEVEVAVLGFLVTVHVF